QGLFGAGVAALIPDDLFHLVEAHLAAHPAKAIAGRHADQPALHVAHAHRAQVVRIISHDHALTFGVLLAARRLEAPQLLLELPVTDRHAAHDDAHAVAAHCNRLM